MEFLMRHTNTTKFAKGDEDISPLDTGLGDDEDQRGRASHGGGPVQLKLKSILDFRSSLQ
jgi:hypothetical protein